MVSTAEGLIGLIASVFAILGGMVIMARYIAKRFDKWANAVIENSEALRGLSERVATLEGAMSKVSGGK